MSKRFISFLICAFLLFSSVLSVNALTVTSEGNNDVTISYGVSESFLVTIPSDFVIDESKEAYVSVDIEEVLIRHGSTIKVKIHSDNYDDGWYLTDISESTNKLEYTISSEGNNSADIVNDSTVIAIASGRSGYGRGMTFRIIDEMTKAGTYQDTLTFTVSVEKSTEEITFRINGKEYTSLASWSFEQWVESEYNIDNYVWGSGGWLYTVDDIDEGEAVFFGENGPPIWRESAVIANWDYVY